jgi:hypothetical protein
MMETSAGGAEEVSAEIKRNQRGEHKRRAKSKAPRNSERIDNVSSGSENGLEYASPVSAIQPQICRNAYRHKECNTRLAVMTAEGHEMSLFGLLETFETPKHCLK